MLTEYLLDACQLEPPEPFVQATAILASMQPGAYLRMHHRKVPYPLFDYCKDLHLAYEIISQGSQACDIIIFHPSDRAQLISEGIL